MRSTRPSHVIILALLVALGATQARLRAADCNGNGIEDADDIANGTSTDCNANTVPDDCDIVPSIHFTEAVEYTTGEQSYGIAIADLDGDDWQDLAIANLASDELTVLFNLGNGSFGEPVAWATPCFAGRIGRRHGCWPRTAATSWCPGGRSAAGRFTCTPAAANRRASLPMRTSTLSILTRWTPWW